MPISAGKPPLGPAAVSPDRAKSRSFAIALALFFSFLIDKSINYGYDYMGSVRA